MHLSPFGVELHRRFTGFFPVSTPFQNPQKYAVLLGIMLALPLIGLMVLGVTKHHFNTSLTSPRTAPPKLFSESVQRVQPFTLTNHLSEPFDSRSLDGKVWLAAFFATDAPHVAQVTKQLLWPNFGTATRATSPPCASRWTLSTTRPKYWPSMSSATRATTV